MAQIQDYLQNRTLSSTEELLTRELSVIQERVNKLEELKANIEDRLQVLEEIQNQPLGVIEQKELKARR